MIHTGVAEEELKIIAEELAAVVQPGERFFLKGPLGSGKSTFARAFIRALGITGPIPSPTFIMDAVYDVPETSLVVHHLDLYRLEGTSEELLMLGFEEILDSAAVVLIEWPERIPDISRRRGCTVNILQGETPDTRRIEIDRNMAGY